MKKAIIILALLAHLSACKLYDKITISVPKGDKTAVYNREGKTIDFNIKKKEDQ